MLVCIPMFTLICHQVQVVWADPATLNPNNNQCTSNNKCHSPSTSPLLSRCNSLKCLCNLLSNHPNIRKCLPKIPKI